MKTDVRKLDVSAQAHLRKSAVKAADTWRNDANGTSGDVWS